MKQGTVSVLCGCHSLIHSLVVLMAWRKWYGEWPKWWQVVCIMIHDIGHWGKDYLDDYEQKKRHSVLGATIAKLLFSQKGYDLVAGHNEYNGATRSELYYPDKYSWVIAPVWWMISTAIFERKLQRKGHTKKESALMFKEAMRKNMDSGFAELGHEIYMRQSRVDNDIIFPEEIRMDKDTSKRTTVPAYGSGAAEHRQAEEADSWRLRSAQGEVCGILDCQAEPNLKCPKCKNHYCDEHILIHFHETGNNMGW